MQKKARVTDPKNHYYNQILVVKEERLFGYCLWTGKTTFIYVLKTNCEVIEE